PLDVEVPDRQPGLEPEADQVVGCRYVGRVRRFRGAEREDRAILELELLPDVIEHHGTTERRGQRGHEQAVIPSRECTRDRRRRVAAQPVRDEPLALEQRLRTRARLQCEWTFYPAAMRSLDCRTHAFPFYCMLMIARATFVCDVRGARQPAQRLQIRRRAFLAGATAPAVAAGARPRVRAGSSLGRSRPRACPDRRSARRRLTTAQTMHTRREGRGGALRSMAVGRGDRG